MSDIFYSRLRRLRRINGYTQADLAKKLNVTQPTVANWESGKKIPKWKNIEKIAEIFNVSPVSLIDEMVEKREKNKSEQEEDELHSVLLNLTEIIIKREREEISKAVKHAMEKGIEPTQYIETIPSADVETVVRCKDCIHKGKIGENIVFCEIFEKDMMPDDFCSCGERRNIKMTNADRIKSMSDEKLAEILMCPNEMGIADIPCDKSNNCNCYKCLLDWLRIPEGER